MKKRRWISVAEQLPEVFEKVIIVTNTGFVDASRRYDEDLGVSEEWTFGSDPIMYWMSIPPIDHLDGVEKGGYFKEAE